MYQTHVQPAPRTITSAVIEAYVTHLRRREKSARTVEKYRGVIRALGQFAAGAEIDQDLLLRWKEAAAKRYTATTVNAMIAAVNGFCAFCGWTDCRVHPLKVQRRIFRENHRELTKQNYKALVFAAKRLGRERLQMILETLAASGIRVSELRFITAEAVQEGTATVSCKGKRRIVLLPPGLCKLLGDYLTRHGITSGPVFLTRNGNPVDRSNLWHEMKQLCKVAMVDSRKVFPHNFRHLFAVVHYKKYKDLAKLADLLGHASINTTKLYIMESGRTHRWQVAQLDLVVT